MEGLTGVGGGSGMIMDYSQAERSVTASKTGLERGRTESLKGWMWEGGGMGEGRE